MHPISPRQSFPFQTQWKLQSIPTFCLTPASLPTTHDLILHCFLLHLSPQSSLLGQRRHPSHLKQPPHVFHPFLFHLHWIPPFLCLIPSLYSDFLFFRNAHSLTLKDSYSLDVSTTIQEGQVVLTVYTSSPFFTPLLHGQLSVLHWNFKKPPLFPRGRI